LAEADAMVATGRASRAFRRAVRVERELLRRAEQRLTAGKGAPRSKREREALARMERREKHELFMLLRWEVSSAPSASAFYERAIERVKLIASIQRAQGKLKGTHPSPVEDAYHIIKEHVRFRGPLGIGTADRAVRVFEEIVKRAQAVPDVGPPQIQVQQWKNDLDGMVRGLSQSYMYQVKRSISH
jgi:hypothetical protein